MTRVAADHPSLPGHFPGRPLVPGVLLLELAVDAARAQFGFARLARVIGAKFLQPVLPEQEIAYAFTASGPRRCRFSARVGDTRVAEGELEFAAP